MNRAAAVAVLLLLVTLAPPPGSGQLAQADLVATGLRVVGDAVRVDGQPADDDLRIEHEVENVGGRDSTGYVVRYSWVAADGEATPLNGAEENSLTNGNPLPAGSKRTQEADWNLQPGQVGAGDVRVTITHDGRTRSTDFPVFVEERSVSLLLQGEAQQILPDETRFFRLVLSNHGNVEETVDLRLPDADEGDNRRLDAEWSPARVTVPAASERVAVLFVEYPFTGVTTDFSAAFTIHAQTGFHEEPIVLETPAVTPATGGFPEGYAFSLLPVHDGTVHAAPGQAREVELTLLNTATDERLGDSYRVTVEATGGWDASTDRDRAALDAGASDTLRVLLRAPSQGTPGTPADLHVEVVSDHDAPDDPRFPARLSLPLRLAGPAVVVTDVRPVASPLYAGDAAEVRVTVRNEGDQPAPAGVLRVLMDAPGREAEATAAVGALEAGATASRRLVLDAAGDGGDVGFTADWTAPTGSQVSTSPGTRTVFVHEPDFDLEPAKAVAGVPGSDVRYAAAPHAFTIRNAGNAAETVVLTATAEGGTVRLLGDETVRLEPGDVRTVPLVQSLPAPTGDLLPRDLTVTAAVEGRPDQTWSATTRTGIHDDEAPTLQPAPAPVEWLRTATLPLRATATDATAVRSLSVHVTAPDGSVAEVDLRPEAAGAWGAGHRFGADGDHALVFTAVDAAGNEATTAPRVVRVGSIPPPVLEPVSVRAGDATPWGLAFPVAVNDTRVVDDLLVSVVGTDEAPRSFPVANGRAQVRLSEFSSLTPGNVTLLLRATNAAGANATLELDLLLLEPEPFTGDEPRRSGERFAPGADPLAALALLGVALALRRRTG